MITITLKKTNGRENNMKYLVLLICLVLVGCGDALTPKHNAMPHTGENFKDWLSKCEPNGGLQEVKYTFSGIDDSVNVLCNNGATFKYYACKAGRYQSAQPLHLVLK